MLNFQFFFFFLTTGFELVFKVTHQPACNEPNILKEKIVFGASEHE